MKSIKILIWLIPLLIILIYQFFTDKAASVESINKLIQALAEWAPGLALNSLLVGIILLVLLLCGMRIYGFIATGLKLSTQLNISAAIPIYFLLGSLFTFLLLMTVGVTGLYNPFVIGAITLVLLLFPYCLKDFFQLLKETAKNIKIQSTLDFHLFLSAFVFFGIPLLLLQLTSIVPTWIDILEVYVAPVQRVLNFSQYLPHDSLPFSFYNSSRSVPLFTAIYSYIASLTGLPAYAAITGSFIFMLFFSLLAVYFATHTLTENPYGGIAVWLFSLSINFLNMHHGRSGALIPIFLAPAIAFIFKMVMAETNKDKLIFAILTGLALGSVTLLHPLLGVYSFGLFFFVALMLIIWLSPRYLYWSSYTLALTGLLSATLIFQISDLTHFSFLLSLFIWCGLVLFSLIVLKMIHFFLRKTLEMELKPKTSHISTGLPIFIMLAVMALVTLIPWHYLWINETPVHFLFYRFPLLLTFIFLALIQLSFIYWQAKSSSKLYFKFGTAFLIIAGIFLLQALPLYLLPFLKFEDSVASSLCAELPTKAYYWISPLLIIFAPLLIYGIKKNIFRSLSLIILQALIVAVPLFIAPQSGFTDEAKTSLQSVAKIQLDFAANGYFTNWDGDARRPLNSDNFKLIVYLKQLIANGRLHIDDTVYHIAQEQHPWVATPFPAFSGVRQALLLVRRDPNDINTKWGRISDFPADFSASSSSKKWVLVEKNVIGHYPDFFNQFQKIYQLEFENNRVSLYHLIE